MDIYRHEYMQVCTGIGVNIHTNINMNMVIGIRRSNNVNIYDGMMHTRISLDIVVNIRINTTMLDESVSVVLSIMVLLVTTISP